MTLLILLATLALGLSFLCSIMESVLLSVTPAYIKSRDESLKTTAQLREFHDDIDRPLAAILSLNTIAHTAGAVGVGAQSAAVFGNAWVGATSALMTVLVLVVSEIIPKTLGAVHWRRLAPLVARLLQPIIWLLWPFVAVSQAITKLFAKGGDTSVRPGEIEAMAELAEEQGVLRDRESTVLKNLLRLREVHTENVMTPRTVIFSLEEERTVGDVIGEFRGFEFSRIPVYERTPERITGYVLKDEVLLCGARDEHSVQLAELKREIHRVSDGEPLIETLETLLQAPGSIAYIVDEFGGMVGLITLEDVVETMLGLEIVDESDSVADLRKLARAR